MLALPAAATATALAEDICPNGGRFTWDITFPGDAEPWDEGEGDAIGLAAMLRFTVGIEPEHGITSRHMPAPGHLVLHYADGAVSHVRAIPAPHASR